MRSRVIGAAARVAFRAGWQDAARRTGRAAGVIRTARGRGRQFDPPHWRLPRLGRAAALFTHCATSAELAGAQHSHPSSAQATPSSTATTASSNCRRPRARCGSATSYRVRLPSGDATMSPHPRKHARWFDTFVRDRSSSRANSAGYPGASSSDSRIRERVGSAIARPRRFITSTREARVSMQ